MCSLKQVADYKPKINWLRNNWLKSKLCEKYSARSLKYFIKYPKKTDRQGLSPHLLYGLPMYIVHIHSNQSSIKISKNADNCTAKPVQTPIHTTISWNNRHPSAISVNSLCEEQRPQRC